MPCPRSDALVESEAWLAHTWEVIGQNEHLLVSVTNAESSARGFIITGLGSSLDSFHDAARSLPDDIQRFKDLTADNPIQQGQYRGRRSDDCQPHAHAATGNRCPAEERI